jgi:hypothetical protein
MPLYLNAALCGGAMPQAAPSPAIVTLVNRQSAHKPSSIACPAAPGLQRLTRLSQLTHLDLGHSNGMAAATLARAPQLPALQSLALRLTYPNAEASTALPSRDSAVLGWAMDGDICVGTT